MSLILSIETSTKACSVALHQAGTLLACYDLLAEKSHSGQLTVLIEQLVKQTGLKLTDLQAIAVAKGPGSYTGLRIGVSTAKGLCFALDKPLVGINTLQAMTDLVQPLFSENTLLCPMIDARRMEVYCGLWAKTGETIAEISAKIIDEYSFADYLEKHPIIFFGDGATKCQHVLEYSKNAIFLPNIQPSARAMGKLAFLAFQQNNFEELTTFEPFYLKEFMSFAK